MTKLAPCEIRNYIRKGKSIMRMNKKGFTLAELLIVIAIISILIAIAVPAFSGSLDNARLQADHANIRNAYMLIQTANITGELEADGGMKKVEELDVNAVYYFCKDGTVSADADSAYACMADGDNLLAGDHYKCASSSVCMSEGQGVHKKNAKLKIVSRSGKLILILE